MIASDAAPLEHTRCRVCKAALIPVVSLGTQYVSDFPHSAGTRLHPPIPLDVVQCSSRRCGLVQLAHTTPPEWLYRQYWYRSGVNESMVAELKDIVTQAVARVDLPAHSIVVDIGANDGTLLAQYEALRDVHLTKVAWEPAINLYEVLRPQAQVLYPEFFKVAEPWPATSRARIVTSIAMFYDLEDPHRFVEDVTKVLHPQGLWVIQQAYLPSMLANCAYDNIVHEHVEYYSLSSLLPLLKAHGLEVFDVAQRTVNGGSFRTYVQCKGGPNPVSTAVAEMLAMEVQLFGDVVEHGDVAMTTFARRVPLLKEQLLATLAPYADSGGIVDLYGASTKSNTLLQYCQIDARQIRQAWERSPEKWGRYAGVSGIPMVSEAIGREDPPAALLVGAWQFREPMIQREAEYISKGGRMIFPLPRVETVVHA